MPDDLENQGGVAVADPPADAAEPAAEPHAGESGRQEPDRATISRGMNDFMRGAFGQDPAATSKPADSSESGESTPDVSGDVEAGQPERGADGRFLPRRAAPEIEKQKSALRDEVRAELLAEQARSAESAKLDELAQTRAADVARYRTLIETPDAQLNGDDYQWREDFKEKLKSLPEVEALHQTLAEQRIAEERAQDRARWRQEIVDLAAEYGADAESWKAPSTTWGSMTRDVVAAATTPLKARISQLERDLHAARTGGLGTRAAPVGAGRSSAGAPPRTMNDWLRGN